MPEDNPTGCYRKHFTIPPSWKGKRCGLFWCLTAVALHTFMARYEGHRQLINASMHCRITIHFEAVNNAFYAWLNGQLLGYSQDSCLPAEFDVTDIVSTAQNTLAVQVCCLHPSCRRLPLCSTQGQGCPFMSCPELTSLPHLCCGCR